MRKSMDHMKLASKLSEIHHLPMDIGDLLRHLFALPVAEVENTHGKNAARAIILGKGENSLLLGRHVTGAFPPPTDREYLVLPAGRRVELTESRVARPEAETFLFGTQPNFCPGPGEILCDAKTPAQVSDMFSAHILWLAEEPLYAGRKYKLVAPGGEALSMVGKLRWRVREDNGEHMAAEKLARGSLGRIEVEMDRAIVFDTREQLTPLSFFVFYKESANQEQHTPEGIGIIEFPLRRADNIRWQPLAISKEDRARALGQKPRVIWFTGLSGSGKSTVASLLEEKLHRRGLHCYVLDGDNVRRGLCKDLGFTKKDRIENMRRVAEVAKLMVDAGLIVLVSFISPLRYEREQIRRMFEPGEFVEVFVDTPLEECERRDIKGLYAKARRGEIKNFTGIDSPYEPPLSPEIHLHGDKTDPDEMVGIVMKYLLEEKE